MKQKVTIKNLNDRDFTLVRGNWSAALVAVNADLLNQAIDILKKENLIAVADCCDTWDDECPFITVFHTSFFGETKAQWTKDLKAALRPLNRPPNRKELTNGC